MAVAVSRGPRRRVGRRTVVGLEHHEHGKASLEGASDHVLEVPVSRCPWEVIIGGEVLEELGLHQVAEPEPSRHGQPGRSCLASRRRRKLRKQILE